MAQNWGKMAQDWTQTGPRLDQDWTQTGPGQDPDWTGTVAQWVRYSGTVGPVQWYSGKCSVGGTRTHTTVGYHGSTVHPYPPYPGTTTPPTSPVPIHSRDHHGQAPFTRLLSDTVLGLKYRSVQNCQNYRFLWSKTPYQTQWKVSKCPKTTVFSVF